MLLSLNLSKMLYALVYAYLFCVFIPQSQSVGDEKSPLHFLPLTQDIVDKFHSLSWDEKIPYLFTEEEWTEVAIQFHLINGNVDARISYEQFVNHFEEFSDPLKVIKFWQGCDTDKDRHIDMREYAHCRGDFDQNGEPYDMNEYEFREANLLANFEPIVVYDEDGIIID